MSLSVAITITTRDRLVELERTCSVISMLNPQPAELIICADGCSDGTVAYVQQNYPEALLIVHEVSRGSIPSRNEMIRSARSDIVVSIDDDSHPIETDAMQRIADLFEANPKLGVASLAQRSNEFPETLTATSFGEPRPLGSFVNCAAAIRKRTFNELGGFPAMFEHMYEEPDFSVRCLAAGWEILWAPNITIRHFWTPSRRSEIRVHHRHARNEAWSVLMRCPFPYWPLLLIYRMFRQFQYAISRGREWVWSEPRWWVWFARGIPRAWRQRRPVSWSNYRAWLNALSNR